MMLLAKCTLALLAYASAEAPRPHIVFLLADDLGWYDTTIFRERSKAEKQAFHNLTQLASEGLRLSQHYTHWHCSPTRRSFLTGRSPLHHGEDLSDVSSDNIDLRWTWISEKLNKAGYVSHWYGKGHTGYESMMHLPANRGFNGGSVLYLPGAGSYYNMARWNGTKPLHTKDTNPDTYSTDLFGSLAVQAVREHDPKVPLFLYLPWQAVHAPYDLPPACKQQGGTETCPKRITAMMHDIDIWVGALVAELKAKGMYQDTLIVWTSDNGGAMPGGNNYPLRGEKHTNWQGGMRTQTFLSGGFLPEKLHGKTHNSTVHITDWYPTFCKLAGVDASDSAPVAPLPVDPSQPDKDIYGNHSWPPVDGINIWDAITGRSSLQREHLWLSAEVVLKGGRFKLVTAQQKPGLSAPPVTGWISPNGTWTDGGDLDGSGCGTAWKKRAHFKPCLFDISNDEREMHDLSSQMPSLVQQMWAELNRSALTAFKSRSPGHLKGPCNKKCANKHWKALWGGELDGPICGVPGCSDDESESVVV